LLRKFSETGGSAFIPFKGVIMTKPLYKYRPALASPEELKQTLVGRRPILDRILNQIRVKLPSKSLQHFLLIGPRGSGKTHLLLLVYHIVKGNVQCSGNLNLSSSWIPILFAEEEYRVTSLTELFVIMLEKIKEETEWIDSIEIYNQISKSNPPGKDECEKILEYLLEKRKKENKRFLLLLDNIHNILPTFTEEDQGRLRDILMTQDLFLLIGAAPTIFSLVADYDKPFYNFFEILWLHEISEEEVEELIKIRLKMDKRENFLKQFENIRYRIKAIIHLTGGNPRLVLSLYEILTEDRILEVEKSLLNILDGLTPYFQDRMSDISVQQRKILDAIALLKGPSTTVEVSKAARLPLDVTNAQLAKLRRGGYVRAKKEKGRKIALYDVSDHLFRLWRQMSLEAGRRRLTIIVRFLEVWFSPEELAERIKKTVVAMETAFSKGEMELAKETVEKLYYYQEATTQIPLKIFAHGRRFLGLIETGNIQQAESEVDNFLKVAKEKGNNDLLVTACMEKAFIYGRKKDYKSQISILTECLNLRPEDVIILNLMGRTFAELKQYEKAIEYYAKAVEIKPVDYEAWYNMGNAYVELKQYDKVIECLTKSIEQSPIELEGFYKLNRAQIFLKLNKFKLALKDEKEALNISRKIGIKSLKDDSVILIFGTSLVLSKRNAIQGKAEKAMEYLEEAFTLYSEVAVDRGQDFIGTYLNDLLDAHAIIAFEVALKALIEKADSELHQFLKPYEEAINYYHTRDPEIINRLFPEIRKIVEEIVAKLDKNK